MGMKSENTLSTFETILTIVGFVLLLFLFILIPFGVRDCVAREEQAEIERNACARNGGVWLWREHACVAGVKKHD
jgi:hypothetical protein